MMILPAAVGLLDAPQQPATAYAEHRARAIKECEAIAPGDYQSGLYFNPDGYRSYYTQSKCLQEAAVRFRDAELCSRVRQRRALLSSSWGYSATQCRKLVTEGIAEDRRTLEALKSQYAAGHVVLRDFRIEPNGNGRDFDVIPSLAGGPGHGHLLQIEILPPDHPQPVLIHASGNYVDGSSNLRIYITRQAIQQRMPGFVPGRRYPVRFTLTWSAPTGNSGAEWSNAFVGKIFPASERSQSLTKEVEFRTGR